MARARARAWARAWAGPYTAEDTVGMTERAAATANGTEAEEAA